MSLQNANYIFIPEPTPYLNGLSSGLTIDASGEKAAMVLEAPETGTITGVGFRVSSFTTTGTVDVRLETVDLATGNPTGTLFGTTTNGSVSVTATGWYNVVFTAGASVALGDTFAIVIVQAAGAFVIGSYGLTPTSRFPYMDLFTTVWTKSTGSLVEILNYNGTYYPLPNIAPHADMTSEYYNNGSATDEYGNKIVLPYAYRIKGLWFMGDLDGDAEIKVYGASTLTKSINNNLRSTTTAAVHYYFFNSTLTVAANETIRISLLPSSVTSVALNLLQVNSAAMLGALSQGANIVGTKRVNAGAWTNETTIQYAIGLIIDRLDDGAGGAGETIKGNPTALLGGYLNL